MRTFYVHLLYQVTPKLQMAYVCYFVREASTFLGARDEAFDWAYKQGYCVVKWTIDEFRDGGFLESYWT